MAWASNKLSAICSEAVYNRINTWYKGRFENVEPRHVPDIKGLVLNTGHRNYLSMWLERFIVKWINHHRPEWKAVKVENKGKTKASRVIGGQHHGQIASVQWVKNPNQIIGEPDLKCLRPGMMPLYFEVKIGKDRLSDAQRAFIAAGWGEVYVVGTVDEFLEIWDKKFK